MSYLRAKVWMDISCFVKLAQTFSKRIAQFDDENWSGDYSIKKINIKYVYPEMMWWGAMIEEIVIFLK